MNNNYSWVSPYQEKKFMDGRGQKRVRNKDKSTDEDSREKVIAIMLGDHDILYGINDETAKIFIEQLHALRIKFRADKVLINISSHMRGVYHLENYLEVLTRNLKPGIELDKVTYLAGTYDCKTKKSSEVKPNYNADKIQVFEENYVYNPNYNVVWFGIADHSVEPNYYKKYQNRRLMAQFRPALGSIEEKKNDNIMNIGTLTSGFLGVIECLDAYISDIQYLSTSKIARKQQTLLPSLNEFELTKLFYSKQFALILRYCRNNKLSQACYLCAMRELHLLLEFNQISSDDFINIKQIYYYVSKHIEPTDKHLLEFRRLEETMK